jgi:hypothetical protein
MLTKETTTSFSVTFSPNEIWFLFKLNSPGVVLGIADPHTQLTEEEILRVEAQTRKKLETENVIKLQGTDQYLLDELISAMIYSCINWTYLITIKDKLKEQDRYFYFLPDWQLEQVYDGDNYVFTLLKDKGEIWPYLVNNINIQPVLQENYIAFEVTERDLELALFLFQSGKKDQAIKILAESNVSASINWNTFLSSYSSPINFLSFETINRTEGMDHPIQRIRQLILLDNAMYWVKRDRSSEEDPFYLQFQPVTFEEAQNFFIGLLPNL